MKVNHKMIETCQNISLLYLKFSKRVTKFNESDLICYSCDKEIILHPDGQKVDKICIN